MQSDTAEKFKLPAILDPRWELFVKVGELHSLTRAALALAIPQSAVSRHISQLELECGSKLFRRTGRGVILTEFGEHIFPRIKELITQAAHLADEMRTISKEPMGVVKIGILPAMVPSLAGRLFSDVLEKYPHVQLHLVEGSSGQLEEWLAEGRVDCSLLLRDATSLARGELLIAQQALHLVSRRDSIFKGRSNVTFDDLEGIPLVVSSRPHALRSLLDGVAQSKGVRIFVQAEADSIRLQHAIIKQGRIYGMMFGKLAVGESTELEAIPIIEPTLSEAVVLAKAPQRPDTLATREVAKRLIALASSLLSNR
ncbi:LysR family transcriptional regulator (plasmid) [Cupriavidus sp. P-10]|uniref:LysR family transcriptional regulator n=1 Tax=unclassified Cupriavidus TaxID=2640874 RepID=UPI001314B7B0|nr:MULTISPECIES: LysR family transcriptional regulator [unclassified Cupriavidus]BDB30643.1 LysR family transcriptional regulator [Cupriavidus sp. P-10]